MNIDLLWPNLNNIKECISPLAENIKESVLLAVHHKTELERIMWGQTSGLKLSEDDMLSDFMSEDITGGIKILPITGSSGSGKSHIIRWLECKIKKSKYPERYHVIRIPKSSSARMVLERILDGLPNNDTVKKFREKLSFSRERIRKESVSDLFCSAFAENLNNVRINKNNFTDILKLDKSLIEFHTKNLAILFKDPVIAPCLIGNFEGYENCVFYEFIKSTIDGRHSEKDFSNNSFNETDLDFINNQRLNSDEFEKASYEAKEYVRKLNKIPRARKEAINVLNVISDDVIRSVLSFKGTDVIEIFLEIRKYLLELHKELVLLIEDFAAVTGIQDTLLDIMVTEGVRDGEQIYCNLRTAFAVTKGKWSRYDTIGTRAVYEWAIVEENDWQTGVNKFVELTGLYLNAARLGAEKIEELFNQSEKESDWLPNYQSSIEFDEIDNINLASFDKSSKGYSLFPFNKNMISSWLEKCSKGNNYEKKVDVLLRDFLNHLLINTLKNYKQSYNEKKFPPQNFLDIELDKTISNELHDDLINKRLRQDQIIRCGIFLYFWGGNPNRIESISEESKLKLIKIAECFGMKIDFNKVFDIEVGKVGGGVSEKPEEPVAPEKQPVALEKTEKPEEQVVLEKPEEPEEPGILPTQFIYDSITKKTESYIDHIELWRKGESLSQDTANFLKKSIFYLLCDNIDWSASFKLPISKTYILKQFKSIHSNIKLPTDIRSNTGILLEPCSCEDWNDEGNFKKHVFIRECISICRFYSQDGKWNYEESVDDRMRIYGFIEKYLEEFKNNLFKTIYRNQSLIDKSIMNLIKLNQALTNLELSNANPLGSLFFMDGQKEIEYPEITDFDVYLKSWSNVQVCLQNELLKNHSAYQGNTGKIPYFIDAIEIESLLKTINESDYLEYRNGIFGDQRINSVFLVTRKEKLNDWCYQNIKKINASKEIIESYLGEYRISDTIKILSKMINKCKKAVCFDKLYTGVDLNEFTKMVDELKEFEFDPIEYEIDDTLNLFDKIKKIQQVDLIKIYDLQQKLPELSKILNNELSCLKNLINSIDKQRLAAVKNEFAGKLQILCNLIGESK